MNTSVITSTRSSNASGSESITSSSMLVDDTASTLPPSPLPDGELNDELPAPPIQQLTNSFSQQQSQHTQILPLQLSTLNNLLQNDLMTNTTLMRNKFNGAEFQRIGPPPTLYSFSSFQQPNQQIKNNKNKKNNSAVYCNPLMHSDKGSIKDYETIIDEPKMQTSFNGQHAYSIF